MASSINIAIDSILITKGLIIEEVDRKCLKVFSIEENL